MRRVLQEKQLISGERRSLFVCFTLIKEVVSTAVSALSLMVIKSLERVEVSFRIIVGNRVINKLVRNEHILTWLAMKMIERFRIRALTFSHAGNSTSSVILKKELKYPFQAKMMLNGSFASLSTPNRFSLIFQGKNFNQW